MRSAEITAHYSRAAVSARIPGGILCLLSALSHHEIGTQIPHKVWIAMPHKARAPRVADLPVRIVRFSGKYLDIGVESVRLDGVPARVTNPARTVVDCFRLRRIVGIEVALEAIEWAIRERKTTPAEIYRVAGQRRAASLVGPYLDLLSSMRHVQAATRCATARRMLLASLIRRRLTDLGCCMRSSPQRSSRNWRQAPSARPFEVSTFET